MYTQRVTQRWNIMIHQQASLQSKEGVTNCLPVFSPRGVGKSFDAGTTIK